MTREEINLYISFMSNPENEHNCTECPENEGRSGRFLCGQQNCWVSCHIHNREEAEG